MDGAAQLVTIGLYAIYSAVAAIWLLVKANKERDADIRRFDASAALAFIALFISCSLAFLEPGALLDPGTLWLALKVCGGTVAVIVTGALVMAAIFAFQADD